MCLAVCVRAGVCVRADQVQAKDDGESHSGASAVFYSKSNPKRISSIGYSIGVWCCIV